MEDIDAVGISILEMHVPSFSNTGEYVSARILRQLNKSYHAADGFTSTDSGGDFCHNNSATVSQHPTYHDDSATVSQYPTRFCSLKAYAV